MTCGEGRGDATRIRGEGEEGWLCLLDVRARVSNCVNILRSWYVAIEGISVLLGTSLFFFKH